MGFKNDKPVRPDWLYNDHPLTRDELRTLVKDWTWNVVLTVVFLFVLVRFLEALGG